MKTAGLLGLAAMSMAAMAPVPYEVRRDREAELNERPASKPERYQKKLHPRRNAHLVGAWRPEARAGGAGGGEPPAVATE